MQLKPRFENFKIKERYELLTDDNGIKFFLTKIEAYIKSDKLELTITPYEFWCVVNNKTNDWSNKKIISYSSDAFWKSHKKDVLFNKVINGIRVKEVLNGKHYIFCNKQVPKEETDFGIKTTFEVSLDK